MMDAPAALKMAQLRLLTVCAVTPGSVATAARARAWRRAVAQARALADPKGAPATAAGETVAAQYVTVHTEHFHVAVERWCGDWLAVVKRSVSQEIHSRGRLMRCERSEGAVRGDCNS